MPGITNYLRSLTGGADASAQPTSDATGSANASKPSGSKTHTSHASSSLPKRATRHSSEHAHEAMKRRIRHVQVTELGKAANPDSSISAPLRDLRHAPVVPHISAQVGLEPSSALPPQRPARPPGHDPLAGMYRDGPRDASRHQPAPRRPDRPPGHDPLAGMYPARPAPEGDAPPTGLPVHAQAPFPRPAEQRAADRFPPAAPETRQMNYQPDWATLPHLAGALRRDPAKPDDA